MIVTCIYVHIKPDSVQRFIDATTANHLESVKEPGNLRFDLIQQTDDETRFMLYEAYESDKASAAHKDTSHYLKWSEDVKDLFQEPRHRVKYNIIQPQDRTRW